MLKMIRLGQKFPRAVSDRSVISLQPDITKLTRRIFRLEAKICTVRSEAMHPINIIRSDMIHEKK